MQGDELEPVRFAGPSFVGATLILGLAGGIAAAYGTFLVGIAHHFGIGISTAGLTISVNFAGALLGVGACWWSLNRVDGRLVLRMALLILSIGLCAAALASSWPAFLAATAFGGIGFGALDFGVVVLMSRTAREGRAHRISISGAGWALGAIVGPLLIALLRPNRYEAFLGIAALIALALIASLHGATAPPVHAEAKDSIVAGRPVNRRSILLTFMLGFALYVALETAVGGWIATRLHSFGSVAAVGALVTAGFWAGLAVGRLGVAPMLRRFSGHGLVLAGLVGSMVLLVASGSLESALIAFPLIGLCLALVFPLALHWFTELSPDDHDGVALIVFVDILGGVIGSVAQSAAVGAFGPAAIPWVSFGLATICLAVFASALRFSLPPTVLDA